MPFEKGNKFRFKPKYRSEDIDLIIEMLKAGNKENEIFLVMMGERPDVSPRSIERWIKIAKDSIDVPAQA